MKGRFLDIKILVGWGFFSKKWSWLVILFYIFRVVPHRCEYEWWFIMLRMESSRLKVFIQFCQIALFNLMIPCQVLVRPWLFFWRGGACVIVDTTSILYGQWQGYKETSSHLFVWGVVAEGIWYKIFRFLMWLVVIPKKLSSLFELFWSLDNIYRVIYEFVLVWHIVVKYI